MSKEDSNFYTRCLATGTEGYSKGAVGSAGGYLKLIIVALLSYSLGYSHGSAKNLIGQYDKPLIDLSMQSSLFPPNDEPDVLLDAEIEGGSALGSVLEPVHRSAHGPTKVAAVAAEIINKTEKEDIDSFFYVHTPKTGTSLYTVLRNSLKSCKVKDFTCFGIFGGGMQGPQSKDGKAHYPYSAKALGIEDGTQEGSCRKTLNCPHSGGTPYHCKYSNPVCRKQRNKVTMFRDPQKWFKSLFEWLWLYEITKKGTFNIEKQLRSYPPQMEFATGKSGRGGLSPSQMTAGNKHKNKTITMILLDEAFEILQSEYLWWGVTDYWQASVCVFHCELGGEERPSETENSRSMTSSMWMKNITEFEATLPIEKHRSAFVSNNTKYVEEHFPGEILFYQDRIMPEFRRRALSCGCGDLLPVVT